MEQELQKTLNKILHAQTLILAMMLKPDVKPAVLANVETVAPPLNGLEQLAHVISGRL